MLIGITYDLKSEYQKMGYSEEEIAEFDTEETIDGIDNAIKALGYNTVRIGHVKTLIKYINEGHICDLVFNICEGLKGSGREAQVPAVLEIFNIPYTFSDVCIMSLTLNKALTKHIVMNAGFATAPFMLVQSLKDLENLNLPFPLFVKPALEGTGKGIDEKSLTRSFKELLDTCTIKIAEGYAPLLIETYLPGREFTVGIIGTGPNAKTVGVIEVTHRDTSKEPIYSYESKAHYEELVNYTIPETAIINKCSDIALGIWNLLGCNDAGRIDLRMDNNECINFIEINPLAGLNHKHSDLPIICRMNGIDFQKLIKDILSSAMGRYNLKSKHI